LFLEKNNMKPHFILLVFLFAINMASRAGDPKFPVSAIADDLKKDANAVVRDNTIIFEIVAQNKGKLYCHQVITILNKNADNYAAFALDYDKLTKITSVSAAVYNEAGEQIKRLRNNEIYDRAAADGMTLLSDNRLKLINLSQDTYPYTVEIEYEKEYRFLLFIDGSTAIEDEKVSLENFSYQLKYPAGLMPRFKTTNIPPNPEKGRTKEGLESLTWKLSNLPAIKIEPYSSPKEWLLSIEAAPTIFEFDGYTGSMATWNDYGKWIGLLNKGRNVLPEATKAKIKELTANLKTTEEKARVLYEYLQSKTRYVSVQLGIGGFQPFEASVVDENGYGDCKALSNYMIAMLDVAGVPAHYALVYAGANRNFDASFPSSRFNHVIVAVPNKTDTLWLECTSQTNPFGYQGYHTGDRQALLITNEGAKIVKTTQYAAEMNTQSRSGDVYLDPNGDAKGTVKTTYSGLQYENENLNFVVNMKHDDQKKWVENNTRIPIFEIAGFEMKNNKAKVPSAQVKVDLTLRKFSTISGKRVFFTPNLMNRLNYIPEKVDQRKTKVVIRSAFVDYDTIRFHIPENIYPESVPEPSKITSRFGEYETSYTVDQASLVYVRKIRINKGVYPPESYGELIDFFKSVKKADNLKAVFLTKT
jgi:hypothetical protein